VNTQYGNISKPPDSTSGKTSASGAGGMGFKFRNFIHVKTYNIIVTSQ